MDIEEDIEEEAMVDMRPVVMADMQPVVRRDNLVGTELVAWVLVRDKQVESSTLKGHLPIRPICIRDGCQRR